MSDQIKEMYKLLDVFNETVPKYHTVCSIDNIKDNCVTFIRSQSFIKLLDQIKEKKIKNLIVIVQKGIVVPNLFGVNYYYANDADLLFTLVNNSVCVDEITANRSVVSKSAIIDQGAIIGAEGLSSAKYRDEQILFRHRGRVIIKDGVYIGANAVIQRGRIDDTIIGKNSMISSLCVVGANTIIGENCNITIQAGISGSAIIGNRVWLGIGAKVRNGIKICDDAFIGMGSIVTKDVLKPGVYAGNPCRFIRPLN